MLTRDQEQNRLWHEIAKIVEKQYDDLQQDHDEKTKNEAKLAEWDYTQLIFKRLYHSLQFLHSERLVLKLIQKTNCKML